MFSHHCERFSQLILIILLLLPNTLQAQQNRTPGVAQTMLEERIAARAEAVMHARTMDDVTVMALVDLRSNVINYRHNYDDAASVEWLDAQMQLLARYAATRADDATIFPFIVDMLASLSEVGIYGGVVEIVSGEIVSGDMVTRMLDDGCRQLVRRSPSPVVRMLHPFSSMPYDPRDVGQAEIMAASIPDAAERQRVFDELFDIQHFSPIARVQVEFLMALETALRALRERPVEDPQRRALENWAERFTENGLPTLIEGGRDPRLVRSEAGEGLHWLTAWALSFAADQINGAEYPQYDRYVLEGTAQGMVGHLSEPTSTLSRRLSLAALRFLVKIASLERPASIAAREQILAEIAAGTFTRLVHPQTQPSEMSLIEDITHGLQDLARKAATEPETAIFSPEQLHAVRRTVVEAKIAITAWRYRLNHHLENERSGARGLGALIRRSLHVAALLMPDALTLARDPQARAQAAALLGATEIIVRTGMTVLLRDFPGYWDEVNTPHPLDQLGVGLLRAYSVSAEDTEARIAATILWKRKLPLTGSVAETDFSAAVAAQLASVPNYMAFKREELNLEALLARPLTVELTGIPASQIEGLRDAVSSYRAGVMQISPTSRIESRPFIVIKGR